MMLFCEVNFIDLIQRNVLKISLSLCKIKAKVKALEEIFKKGKRRVYIVEISRQLLDVLLQLIRCLQAILKETAEERRM